MKLYILGSGCALPSPRRGSPGLALIVEEELILIDTGSGSLRMLGRLGLPLASLRFLIYSHFHPDHIADLVPLLFALRTGVFSISTLTVIGPPGLPELWQGLREIYKELIVPKGVGIRLIEAERGELSFDNFSLKISPVLHTDSSLAYRFTDKRGKSLVYSGDTDYCEAIVSLAKEADLLVLECSFPEGKKEPGHLTPTLAGRIAREASAKVLLLTHFYPVVDRSPILREVKREFSREVILAEDGMVVPIL